MKKPTKWADKLRHDKIATNFREILELLGEDTERNGLKETPQRVARFLCEFVNRPQFNLTVFDEPGANELVLIRNIPWASLCEHHCLPFEGKATIGYIPNGKTIGGLSKFARCFAHFAAGLNNQERITSAVGEFLSNHPKLKPKAVGVITEATHTCMTIRGAKAIGSSTVTHYFSPLFLENPSAKAEFLSAVQRQLL